MQVLKTMKTTTENMRFSVLRVYFILNVQRKNRN